MTKMLIGASVLALTLASTAFDKVTKAANGMITVVQQPGANNSLGLMKIDMPNPHAIYLHDTPSKALFNTPVRAYSHGCVRTERAVELGMTMAILGAGLTPEQAVQYNLSGKYTKVPMTKTFPVYLTYFTMATGIDGKMGKFADIYGRDAPVLAALKAPRQLHTDQRKSNEKVIEIVDEEARLSGFVASLARPGGNVTGLCGYNAARVIATDAGKRP